MIYKALADLASNQNDSSVNIIEPATLESGEKVNKTLSEDIINNYEAMVVSATNLEEFSKALNAIAGAMGLNLNTDLIVLAKIANKLREVKGLSPL